MPQSGSVAMCGIAGFICPELGKHALNIMLDSMVFRGPDGVGSYSYNSLKMGMRRLSVIDLDHGWQPLFAANGNVVVFQNGEIYNFEELRSELECKGYIFKTNSDTEVLAHGYHEWAIDGLLKRIDGMYAFAILDKTTSKLYLARDRFGEKPLFFASKNGRFVYSSTLTAAAIMPWIDCNIDQLALKRYLALHFCPGRQTILKDIFRVLPGEYIAVNINTLNIVFRKYYFPVLNKQRKVSSRILKRELEKAVMSRMVADVPVGVFLSGGLDSSIIAAIASRESAGINTFSIGFSGSELDESPYARRVASYLGTCHHEFQFDMKSFVSLLPVVASSLDEPVGDQALLPLYWLCKEAVKHVTVVLAGEGADELFSGYFYYKQFLKGQSLRNRISALFKQDGNENDFLSSIIFANQDTTGSGFPILCGEIESLSLLTGESPEQSDLWEMELLELVNKSYSALQRASAVDVTTWLPDDLLVKFDRMAMAHSLEGRAPFLAPPLAEIGLSLPDYRRMNQGASKVLLRKVAQSWLPTDILERDKHGFVLPMRQWLMQWFKESGGVKNYFVMKNNLKWLDIDCVIKIVNNDLKCGVNRDRFIFALLLLSEWSDVFFTNVSRLRQSFK